MVYIIGVILAVYGIADLFTDADERSLPWWGDITAVALGATIVLVSRFLFNDDD